MGVNMMDENEVKEYLNNLETEYQFSCYRENNGQGCCLVGEFMETIREDFPKAAAAFKRGCDSFDFGKACFKYAMYAIRGRTMPKDVEKAVEYGKKGCEFGWNESCTLLGFQYSQAGPLQDFAKAAEYYKRGCELNSVIGCGGAASAHFRGRGVPTDHKKALQFMMRACYLEDPQACANAAFMFKNGHGTEVDMEKAEKLLERAKDIKRQYERMRSLEMEQGIET